MSTNVKVYAVEHLVHIPCFPGTLNKPEPGEIGFMYEVYNKNKEVIGFRCTSCGYSLKMVPTDSYPEEMAL